MNQTTAAAAAVVGFTVVAAATAGTWLVQRWKTGRSAQAEWDKRSALAQATRLGSDEWIHLRYSWLESLDYLQLEKFDNMPILLLDLSYNQLVSLLVPDNSPLLGLQCIKLNGNRSLTTLDGLEPLQNTLQVLIARRCRIQDISALDDFSQLYHLDLTHNMIKELPEGLNSLRHLDLKNNSLIANLPPSFGDSYSHLKHLNLQGMQLRQLPLSFSKLSQLAWLSLRGNKFSECDSVQHLTSLTYLDLTKAGNGISFKLCDLSSLQELKEIRLSGMRLTEFPLFLIKLPKLEYLDLSRNSISSVPKEEQLVFHDQGRDGGSVSWRRINMCSNLLPDFPSSLLTIPDLECLCTTLNLFSIPLKLESEDAHDFITAMRKMLNINIESGTSNFPSYSGSKSSSITIQSCPSAGSLSASSSRRSSWSNDGFMAQLNEGRLSYSDDLLTSESPSDSPSVWPSPLGKGATSSKDASSENPTNCSSSSSNNNNNQIGIDPVATSGIASGPSDISTGNTISKSFGSTVSGTESGSGGGGAAVPGIFQNSASLRGRSHHSRIHSLNDFDWMFTEFPSDLEPLEEQVRAQQTIWEDLYGYRSSVTKPPCLIPREVAARIGRELIIDRIAGCIYGAAIADAIGLCSEGLPKDVANFYYDLQRGLSSQRGVIQDTHRSQFEPGDWTEETDYAVLLMDNLASHKGNFHAGDYAKALKNWDLNGFAELGDAPQMLRSDQYMTDLINHKDFATSNPSKAATDLWAKSGQSICSNQSIARSHIIGCGQFWKLPAVISTATNASQSTHSDPRCVASSVAIAVTIAHLISSDPSDSFGSRYESTLNAILEPSLSILKTANNPEYSEEFKKAINSSHLRSINLDEHNNQSHTFKPLAAAFWALKNSPNASFENLISRIVLEAGDSDANAAVAGAVLGAMLGFRSLPARWIAELLHPEWLSTKIKSFVDIYGISI